MDKQVENMSVLTCPECGHEEREEMPADSCIFFYECKGCETLLRPSAGDCCVFCSYGSIPCPPVQAGEEPKCEPQPLRIERRS